MLRASLATVQAKAVACGENFQAKMAGLKLRSSSNGAELRAAHGEGPGRQAPTGSSDKQELEMH